MRAHAADGRNINSVIFYLYLPIIYPDSGIYAAFEVTARGRAGRGVAVYKIKKKLHARKENWKYLQFQ